jgi:hypothetical protein
MSPLGRPDRTGARNDGLHPERQRAVSSREVLASFARQPDNSKTSGFYDCKNCEAQYRAWLSDLLSIVSGLASIRG